MTRKYSEFGLKFSFCNCNDDDNNNTLSRKISTVKLLFSFKFILVLFKAYPVVGDGWFQPTQFVLIAVSMLDL